MGERPLQQRDYLALRVGVDLHQGIVQYQPVGFLQQRACEGDGLALAVVQHLVPAVGGGEFLHQVIEAHRL